uniref:Uncharacterized protein n=1 Tax=Neobodo designis TaxID=312471 RepID=A0A7S1M3P9_NEODS|mmetsp:Transcript_33301/g.102849  ORF Transcript_33301/g.102849 Transcript_33301/m.102849 type:complete len:269 (+) Transcript_33301:58-864(+)
MPSADPKPNRGSKGENRPARRGREGYDQPQPARRQPAAEPTGPPETRPPPLVSSRAKWCEMVQSESDVLRTLLVARGRHRAYRHHLWMRRMLELHRLTKQVATALAALPPPSEEKATTAALPELPSADRILRVAAVAGREALNEVGCDRMDTIGVGLCLAAVAARFHSLFSLPELRAVDGGDGVAVDRDEAAFAWAMPPVVAAALGIDPVLLQRMAELAIVANPRGFQAGRKATFGRQQRKADGGEDDAGPPRTLGELLDSVADGTCR